MPKRCFPLLILTLAAAAAPAVAETTLPCLFSDHMVLQSAEKVPVWGTTTPGLEVQVNLHGASAHAVADANGHWMAYLDLRGQAGGPYQLVVAGDRKVVVKDVLVGEVWLASGQSNMEFALSESLNGAQVVASSRDDQLREFKVLKHGASQPADRCEGQWMVADPQSAGGFTAVGYYFGRVLREALHVPVALIGSYYGGSDIEAWLSSSAIDHLPSIEAAAQKMMQQANSYPGDLSQYQADYAAWQQRYHRPDRSHDFGTMESSKAATTVKLPGEISQGEPSLANGGAIWLSKKVNVPAKLADNYLAIHFGAISGSDEAYWNGVRFGITTPERSDAVIASEHSDDGHRYDVPGKLVKAGEATLSIRIFNPAGVPAMSGVPKAGSMDAQFPGPWQRKIEFTEPPLDDTARASFPLRPPDPPSERFIPANLYNAMVHPLIPYAMRGTIWYQGESNVSRGFAYRSAFAALIQDWRQQWGEGDFPFYFCQIANFQAHDTHPRESGMADLRESQSLALKLPNTGQAVTIDLGEEQDIHFRNKQPAGQRLARLALAKTYGHPIPWSGPAFNSFSIEGDTIRISFQHIDGGLAAHALPDTYKPKSTLPATVALVRNSPQSELEGFAICGPDHRWAWANARIDGATVIVSSPQVPHPVAVRYGWSDNPITNLYNGAGLPASPFRTDDYPVSTQNKTLE